MSSTIEIADALTRWREALRWLPDADDPEEVFAALLWRDAVVDALADARPSAAESAELRRIDADFVALRPALLRTFPDVFLGAERGATPEEWWWWPDRMPADGVARAS